MANCVFTQTYVYFCNFDRKYLEQLKNTFHQLFEKYKIDLVLSGHTQYYQRSLPLAYNNYNTTNPFVINQNNNEYTNKMVSSL